MELEFHTGLDLNKFWIEWFGIHGRELGSTKSHSFGTHPKGYIESHRMFTQDPTTYIKFIDWCHANKHACWITSQPMRGYNQPLGIEKIFFDFDYPLKKNQKMTPLRKKRVKKLVYKFLEPLDCEPYLVETRKGYHAYIFLRRIYEFDPRNLDFATEVFGVIGLTLLGLPKLYHQLKEKERKKWKYLDFSPLADIMRHARVPLTIHEKSGDRCLVLNRRLEPTKVRSLDLYKAYGLREDTIREAAEIVKAFHKKAMKKKWKSIERGAKSFDSGNGYEGRMRPCFTERLYKIGEMTHPQRLAFLMEAYNSGYNTEAKLMGLCHSFKDFLVKKSLEQIRWFLKNKTGFPPYRCETIMAKGWCLKDECPKYRKKYK